ncbi:unnamed protein product [Cuscuta epithymum]|uniref:Uncharacterized protein n=1 Tax=Cuscuta epithymum TaxID=186058 RepID=A0AAV0CHL9_9ASTE|nr:unnamed protein product [Cuscuta epithymum]
MPSMVKAALLIYDRWGDVLKRGSGRPLSLRRRQGRGGADRPSPTDDGGDRGRLYMGKCRRPGENIEVWVLLNYERGGSGRWVLRHKVSFDEMRRRKPWFLFTHEKRQVGLRHKVE